MSRPWVTLQGFLTIALSDFDCNHERCAALVSRRADPVANPIQAAPRSVAEPTIDHNANVRR